MRASAAGTLTRIARAIAHEGREDLQKHFVSRPVFLMPVIGNTAEVRRPR
jgi:hypothetical protein